MTINELIEMLKDVRDESLEGGETEVRIMSQPSWPFEYSIRGIALKSECHEEQGDVPYEDEEVVYLVEGTQLGYGTKAAWDVVRDY
jgi:hypothetical protein